MGDHVLHFTIHVVPEELPRDKLGLPWELLHAHDLVLVTDSLQNANEKFKGNV